MRSSIGRCLLVCGAVVALALPVVAAAQTVYRCGASYSQQPCDEGRPVRVDDARSDAQQRDAEQAVSRQARIARRLESERLTARPAPVTVAGIAGRGSPAVEPPASKTARKKRRKSTSSDAEFSAAVPRPAKTKATARD